MNALQLAALIAAVFWALLVCVGVFVLFRLGRLLSQFSGLTADLRERGDLLLRRAQTAVDGAQAVEFVGLPEARINLAQAVIHISMAPKSNAVIKAISAAGADVRAGLVGAVPTHLRDAHYPGAGKVGHGEGYLYPHDFDDGIVAQRYAPDPVADRIYYEPSGHGQEARVAERAGRIRAILRKPSNASNPSRPSKPS